MENHKNRYDAVEAWNNETISYDAALYLARGDSGHVCIKTFQTEFVSQETLINDMKSWININEGKSLKNKLDNLTDYERKVLFVNYCKNCGSKNPFCKCKY